MIRTVLGRYALFSLMGLEILLLPYFFQEQFYAEADFIKFTSFLAQFALLGAGTGYVVQYLKFERKNTEGFELAVGAYAVLVGVLAAFFVHWAVAISASLAILALAAESMVKVKEKYLLAMAFKPILSVVLVVLIPLVLYVGLGAEEYFLTAIVTALLIYAVLIALTLKISLLGRLARIKSTTRQVATNFVGLVKSGVIMNASTALVFLFFYTDRAIVRVNFNEDLADYSLAYSIMQLTVVAITTFSYVNIIDFGKAAEDAGELKNKVHGALKKCFLYYAIFGVLSIAFSFVAEKVYLYDKLFETTVIMVLLFGFASVLMTVNSVFLYLRKIHMLALFVAVALLVSLSLNYYVIDGESSGYYFLLLKTYGTYLILSFVTFFCVTRLLNDIKQSED